MFCNKLSQLMELEPVYSKNGQTNTNNWGDVPTSSNDEWNKIECNWNANGYRLPTEAEWELAARGGDPEEWAWHYDYAGSGIIDGVAWYYANSSDKTHQVGRKTNYTLELHDMSGNVWEWCWDRYDYYGGSDAIDADTPSDGAASGSYRVHRGGSWDSSAYACEVTSRSGDNPPRRLNTVGFRLVRSAN